MSEHDYKRCTKCEIRLPKNKFAKNPKGRGGLEPQCKECRSQWNREYYKRNRKRINQRNKEYWQKNREWFARRQTEYQKTKRGREVFRRGHLKYAYGISLERHEQMYVDQGGCCPVCGEAVLYNKIHTDHDHKTGKVRGLLCRKCNLMLGYAEDDPSVLESAAKYLRSDR